MKIEKLLLFCANRITEETYLILHIIFCALVKRKSCSQKTTTTKKLPDFHRHTFTNVRLILRNPVSVTQTLFPCFLSLYSLSPFTISDTLMPRACGSFLALLLKRTCEVGRFLCFITYLPLLLCLFLVFSPWCC